MSVEGFTPNRYRKSTLPNEQFAQRFAPQITPEGSDSISEVMRLESRKNIREFLLIQSKLHNGFDEPIVDAGCGFRTNFSEATAFSTNKEVNYIAFDHFIPESVDPYPPDFAASVYKIPLPDSCAGTVLCTEVLEHVEFPGAALTELVRILKPGGTLLLTVPGRDVPQHQKPPFQYDYQRFSGESLEMMLHGQGISDIEITRRWFEEDGEIKEINVFAVGKKQERESS